ncbi:hypothetical protein KR018_012424, partial [Drosophila ironensis]
HQQLQLEMFLLCVLLLIYSTVLTSAGWSPGRIVGGEPVNISSVPWQASLQMNGRHLCGAAIYSKNILITAAHCIDSTYPTPIFVRVGSSSSDSGGQVGYVVNALMHEHYNRHTIANDVAVLRLHSNLKLGDSVRTIALADVEPKAKANATVSGWGATEFGSPASPILLATNVSIVSRRKCNRAYGSIEDVMICASAPGKDACQGDSGGPLVSGGKLVGIVSFGYECARPHFPGVYANVAKLRHWIKSAAERI